MPDGDYGEFAFISHADGQIDPLANQLFGRLLDKNGDAMLTEITRGGAELSHAQFPTERLKETSRGNDSRQGAAR